MRISRGALLTAISSVVALGLLIGGFFVLTQLWQAGRRAPGRSSAAGQLRSPFTGEPVSGAPPGADLQDRQRAAGQAADRADEGGHRLPAAGRRRAEPDLRGVLLARPAGGRAGAQLARGGHQAAAAVRQASVRVLRRPAAPAAGRRARQDRRPVRGHRRRLFPRAPAGSRRTTCTPGPRRCSREAKGASKARDIGFRFGACAAGGKPTTVYNVSYPAAAFSFRWSAAAHRWLIWMDGKPAPRPPTAAGSAARTVVVQYVNGRHVGLPRARDQAAVRAHRRQRQRGRAARRPRLPRALVAPARRRRHRVHAA